MDPSSIKIAISERKAWLFFFSGKIGDSGSRIRAYV